MVTLDELVDGEVGLHAGDMFERLGTVVAQRHSALVGGVVRPLQADHGGASGRRRSSVVERLQFCLIRFGQLDRGVAPAVTDAVVALQD